MTFPADVSQRLQRKRQHVEDARRRLELAEAELRAFEEAVRMFAGSEVIGHDPSAAVQASAVYKRRGRPLKPEWKAVLTRLVAEHPKPCSLPIIEKLMRDHDYQGVDSSIRAQMSAWAKQGVVSRVADGFYAITDKGASIIGLDLPSQPTLETADIPE